MNIESFIGFAAGTLTTISFVPQAIKTIRTKETHGISLYMYILFTTGILFWLAFGILTLNWPVIIPNAITLFLSSIILIMKILYR